MARKTLPEDITLTNSQQAGLRMAEQVGPFLTEASLMKWLGSTLQEIRGRAEKRELLAVQSVEGDFFYPERQFLDNGSVVPGLRDVLNILESGTSSEWTWALWLTTKSSTFSERTALDSLRDGDFDVVLRVAEHDARRWAE